MFFSEISSPPVICSTDSTLDKLALLNRQAHGNSPCTTAMSGGKSQEDANLLSSNWNADMCTLKREMALSAISQQLSSAAVSRF